MFRNLRLTIQHLWAVTALVGVFIFVSTHPIRPQDFWWHMAVGREVLATGRIPSVDTFSYTMPGKPYPAYQVFWLMESILYVTFRAGGGEMVIFLQSLLITSAYGIILWLCYLETRSWRVAAFGVLFAAALGLNDWNVRPQAITFLLGALILLAINRLRMSHNDKWLVIFPVAMVVWVNSHGTFPIGLALIGAWWLDSVWFLFHTHGKWEEHLLSPTIAGVVATLACMLSPQGFGIFRYIQSMMVSPVIQNLVTEWAPPSFGTLGGTLFFIGLLLCACVMAISPKRPSLFQVILFVIFAVLGLKTMRGVVWFGIVMAPVVAEHVKAIADSISHQKQNQSQELGSPWLNRIFLFILLGMAILSLPWFKHSLPLPSLKAGIFSNETPITATEILLNERLPGPLFNSMSFGSYLIWEARSDYPVFIDPRIDLYPTEFILEYISVSSGGEHWQEVMDKYGIQTIMASPTEQSGLIDILDQSTSWDQVYQDEAAVIFTRK